MTKAATINALLRYAVFSLLIATLPGCVSSTSPRVPLPGLPQGPIELRVAYAVNPRLPRMTAAQLTVLLAAAGDAAREHFGTEILFTPVAEVAIDTLFKEIPDGKRKELSPHIFDFKSGRGDPSRLGKEFAKGLKESGESLTAMVAYARPYLEADLNEASYDALGAALAKLELARIERWKAVRAMDGGAAVDASPYNEYLMWVALGYGHVPYDLVLTNQPIVSVEDLDPSVHSAIRGGYANGVTTYGKESRYGTFSVWSTFAFTTDDPWVKGMRGGESYTPEEAARLAGISAAHELGHLLFHFLHPFGNRACIMNPVPMFGYRAWANGLSAKDCPIGSEPAMRPGACRMDY